jgi:hypothetical protein
VKEQAQQPCASALSLISPPYQALDGKRPSDRALRAFDSNQLRIPYPLHGRRHISEKKGISSCFLQDTDLKLREAKCAWEIPLPAVTTATVELAGGSEAGKQSFLFFFFFFFFFFVRACCCHRHS